MQETFIEYPHNKEDNMIKKYKHLFALLFIALFFIGCLEAKDEQKNGFDISNAIIDKNKILSGGPPKDGIPAINNPKFVNIKDVDYLKADDIIIGVVRDGISKAYPTRILIWHEIVNDTINKENIVVTYCPLCGTAMVFERDIGNITRTFGVSGLLYQSDVLMYDKESESLWSQLGMESVSGKAVGSKLKWINSEHMTWNAWKNKYPNSKVLSIDTGFYRNYSANAYDSYFKSDQTMFPVTKNRDELAQKSWVVGVVINGVAKAYSIEKLEKESIINDTISEVKIKVRYDKNKKYHKITNNAGEEIPSVVVYWFAWQAFYPKTLLW
jgi:hypothetical protein